MIPRIRRTRSRCDLLFIPLREMRKDCVFPSGVDTRRGTDLPWSGSEQPGRTVFGLIAQASAWLRRCNAFIPSRGEARRGEAVCIKTQQRIV
ncbi:hypothetical protein J3E68DRAFT_402013 [Trichoderma sp. SZMC 28012]